MIYWILFSAGLICFLVGWSQYASSINSVWGYVALFGGVVFIVMALTIASDNAEKQKKEQQNKEDEMWIDIDNRIKYYIKQSNE